MKFAKAIAAATKRAVPVFVRDLCGLLGISLISYGAWLVYVPAGFIVGGVFLAGGAFLVGGRGK